MKFFSRHKSLAVISKKTQKTIAQFKDGEFETDKPELMEKLQKHFGNDGIDFKTLNYWKLRKMAEEKGLKHHNLKKVDLVRLLERSERNG